MPPTETRDKKQTSTVTVSVISNIEKQEIKIDKRDLQWVYFKSTGPGGQHKNKTESAVKLTHIPSGIVSVAQNERSQTKNKQIALERLEKRLNETRISNMHDITSKILKEQRKSGMRGDKIRTYKFQEDTIINHLENKKIKKIDRFMKGNIEIVW